MIKKILFLLNLLFLISCSGVDLVLNEKNENNNLRNNSLLILNGINNKVFSKEIYSYFGNNKNGEYILTTTFSACPKLSTVNGFKRNSLVIYFSGTKKDSGTIGRLYMCLSQLVQKKLCFCH